MNRFAFLCLLGCCCAWVAPLRAENAGVERTPGLGERLRELFGVGAVSHRYDPRMIRAAEIAAARAEGTRPKWHCWRSVKDALLAAGVVSSRPVSPWAKQAGDELCARYGFTKIAVSNPFHAPVGAVIVYGGADAGHVELRTSSGFVSDFHSPTPYPRPLIGVYVKPS
ncbi:MAG: hypothetical protein PHQ12_13430 [Chthoniobacteraceae bacterium]|nr:hypothetical protein [Chthoniobacteraceae bacterium]